MKHRVVAVIGPPNVGKTTLFNRLTGLRQKVANYSGVTVEQRSGRVKGSHTVLLDLPGVWSLDPTSEDQRIAVAALNGTLRGSPRPDAVLLVVDGTQLHRQQTLIDEVLSTGKPTMLVINMADILAARSGFIDPLGLARSLGAPVALVSASNGNGMDQVLTFVNAQTPAAPSLLPILQKSASPCKNGCAMDCGKLESDGVYRRALPSFISRRIDAVVLHPVVGPLFFLAIVLGVFQCIFSGALPLSNAMQDSLTALGDRIAPAIANPGLRSLFFDGIWASSVSILGFLPQVLGLFLLIALLEDTGYMARAAVITDRTMSRVGLNGRSFLPLLSAYACAVPAIMGARSIPSKRDRLTTILIAPFMTCSARLPVYTVIIAAVIPSRSIFFHLLGLQAGVMLALYAIGLIAALITAKILNSTVLKSADTTFAIELPEYRLPSLRSLAITLADRCKVFLKQVGTIILALSVFIWALAHFPIRHGVLSDIASSYLAAISRFIEPALTPIGLNAHVGISLLTAFVARESVVSTLGTIYGQANIGTPLRAEIGLAGALALLVFFSLALQCTSTIAVTRRETNSWRWPILQLAYMTTLAYAGAYITFHLAHHFF
jgi:ferrous iron transport protein B